jgi:hypothetical protein
MFGGTLKYELQRALAQCVSSPIVLARECQVLSICSSVFDHVCQIILSLPLLLLLFAPPLLTRLEQYCLRVDVPQTWANPKPQKFILCFTNDVLYLRAARSIRQAQFVHFESLRLSSQPDGAMQTNELSLAGALGVTNAEGGQSFTQDLKVKEGDDVESQKSVSVDGEVLVIESKSKSGLGMRSKRSIISTVGLPISFVNALTISVPSRLADITITFTDSVNRDLFAYKLFLHSKGHYNFESNFGIESVRGSTMLTQSESTVVRSDSIRFVPWNRLEFWEKLCIISRVVPLYYLLLPFCTLVSFLCLSQYARRNRREKNSLQAGLSEQAGTFSSTVVSVKIIAFDQKYVF